MMETFQEYNVEFVSSTEKFDTSTPMGRAMLNICIVFAPVSYTHLDVYKRQALTDDGAALLSRYTDQVVLIYDGDTAGQNATQRAIPCLLYTSRCV